jgi:hypothetical protein
MSISAFSVSSLVRFAEQMSPAVFAYGEEVPNWTSTFSTTSTATNRRHLSIMFLYERD